MFHLFLQISSQASYKPIATIKISADSSILSFIAVLFGCTFLNQHNLTQANIFILSFRLIEHIPISITFSNQYSKRFLHLHLSNFNKCFHKNPPFPLHLLHMISIASAEILLTLETIMPKSIV
jgi:hypothetical protein